MNDLIKIMLNTWREFHSVEKKEMKREKNVTTGRKLFYDDSAMSALENAMIWDGSLCSVW